MKYLTKEDIMQQELQIVRIGEKYYDAAKLTEKAIALFNDINKIDGELGRLQLQTSITNVAKSKLVDDLVAETANLDNAQVPAPTTPEAQ